jgi:hypothetical protein
MRGVAKGVRTTGVGIANAILEAVQTHLVVDRRRLAFMVAFGYERIGCHIGSALEGT